MTRINCVPVQELSRLHLLAEYKELPRVFKLARRVPNPPREYVLGRGHVTFFYDKLGYCEKRFYQLVREELHVKTWNDCIKFLNRVYGGV